MAAIRLPQDRWPAFLDEHCGADAGLRRRVERLLAAHRAAADRDGDGPPDPDETVGYSVTVTGEEEGDAVGPYRLLERVGEGGMGVVYVAEQAEPVRRRVALKVIKPGMDSREVIARFAAERQALALMDHPNIARVFDGGTTAAGRPYFVMELVRGLPVTDYCDAARLPAEGRLRLFAQVCRAVQHAHQKGVIHRDLKPSNVLVTVVDGEPVPKVIDFGVAKAVSGPLTDRTVYTRLAQMVGTPLYMAPEQAELSGVDVDTRADVYSLGVLLYELLTGTTPFDPAAFRAAGFDGMRRMIREDDPPRPSHRLSTLDAKARSTVSERRGIDDRRLGRLLRGDLDRVVMKALEKDRNRRYQSPAEFAADVDRFLADEPVAARPASALYRARKLARRNRGRVAAAGVLVLAAVLAAAGVGWARVERAGERARAAEGVRESLAGARAAAEAGDLDLAGRRVAEARGRLGPDPGGLADLAADVDRAAGEVDARRADADRFRRFVTLSEDSWFKVDSAQTAAGDRDAEEALALYGVLSDDDWVTRLDRAHLTAGQKARVREVAYVTLLFQANHHPDRGLDLLRRAEAFHQPTRGFFYVRSVCRDREGDQAGATEDRARAKTAPAGAFWDYHITAHLNGGDPEEAVRGYEAALRAKPDDFFSLFHMATRLGSDRLNRRAEAVQVLRACIALRPGYVLTYLNRARLLEELGRRDEAEGDLTAAVSRAATDHGRLEALRGRANLYWRTGRPKQGQADDALAEGLVRQMAEEKAARFGADHPDALRAAAALGRAHFQAGRYADAIRTLEPTLRKLEAALGPDHPDVLLTMNDLGAAYGLSGRHADAVRMLEPALAKRTARHGADHSETLTTMHNLGSTYTLAGRHADAVRVLQAAVEKHSAVPGPDPANLPRTMSALGVAYSRLGRHADAVRTLEDALGRTKAAIGPNHPDTFVVITRLSAAYDAAKRFGDAVELCESALEEARAALGPDNPHTLTILNNLGASYIELGRPEDAARVLEVVLERRAAVLGPDHPQTLGAMTNLGMAYLGTDRIADAARLFEATVGKMAAVLGPDHAQTQNTRVGLLVAYEDDGQLERAGRLRAEEVERARRASGPKSAETGSALVSLGRNLLLQRKYAEAEPHLREGLSIRDEKLPDDWRRFAAMNLLGEALLGQKRYAEAEPLLLRGYDGMKQREGAMGAFALRYMTKATERVAVLYEATGRQGEAAAWRARLPRPVAPLPRSVIRGATP